MEDGASEEYQWFYVTSVTSLLGNVVCIDGCSDTRSLIHHTYYIMESDEAKIVAVMSASAVFNMRFTDERPR